MTVKGLKEAMARLESQGFGNDEVQAFDADEGDMAPVTGFLFVGMGKVELCTDDNS